MRVDERGRGKIRDRAKFLVRLDNKAEGVVREVR